MEFNANVNFTYYDTVSGGIAAVSGWGAVDVIHYFNIIWIFYRYGNCVLLNQESKVVSTKLREAKVFSPANCDLFPADLYDSNIMFCWGDSGINGFNMLT